MIPPEYLPVVIAAHRNDLRQLYQPQRRGTHGPSTRQRIGNLLVRAGQWLEDRRNEAVPEPELRPCGEQAGV